ncbi:MAG: hypothetical protein R2867_01575 [Caldilineaceae bacterium]
MDGPALAYRTWLVAPVVVALGVLGWELLVRWQQYPIFILPGPLVVGQKLLRSGQ